MHLLRAIDWPNVLHFVAGLFWRLAASAVLVAATVWCVWGWLLP